MFHRANLKQIKILHCSKSFSDIALPSNPILTLCGLQDVASSGPRSLFSSPSPLYSILSGLSQDTCTFYFLCVVLQIFKRLDLFHHWVQIMKSGFHWPDLLKGLYPLILFHMPPSAYLYLHILFCLSYSTFPNQNIAVWNKDIAFRTRVQRKAIPKAHSRYLINTC